ncbi:MAG: hypothetical protein WA702_21345 [Bradyrhizobium sp.]|uniref:hypothetical protein n=1 Tax=Bradyrhizobium sp. TaxID=376 RepID=UPI003C7AFDE9
MTCFSRRSMPAIGFAFVVLLAGALAPAQATDADIAHILAPTGKLRAALYPGTPTSILPDPNANLAASAMRSARHWPRSCTFLTSRWSTRRMPRCWKR